MRTLKSFRTVAIIFLDIQNFQIYLAKFFLIIFKFSYIDYSTMFRKSNVNKTVYFVLVSLKYGEIIPLKQQHFVRNFIFSNKSLKSKKKKLALTLFYYVSR